MCVLYFLFIKSNNPKTGTRSEWQMLKSWMKDLGSSPWTCLPWSWKNNDAFFQTLTLSEHNPRGSLFIAFSKNHLHVTGLACVFQYLFYHPSLNLVYLHAALVRGPSRDSPSPHTIHIFMLVDAPEPGLFFSLGSSAETWLHIRLTQQTFQMNPCPDHTPERLMQNLEQWVPVFNVFWSSASIVNNCPQT